MVLFTPQKGIYLNECASCVGPLEGKGPLGKYFDFCFDDEIIEEESYEKAEAKFAKTAFETLLKKANKKEAQIELIFGGDLMNQCTATSHALKDNPSGYIGLYGACSTFVLGAINACSAIASNWVNNSVFISGSHFATAERQFRTPLEYGGQRPPSSQVTVTGYCAALMSSTKSEVRVKNCLAGRIVDSGLNDITDMGAVMAPAAADTLKSFFELSKSSPDDYDLIVTGDLGARGNELCKDILKSQGVNLKENFKDCGMMIFDPLKQDVHCGGSGCGCSATVFGGYLFKKLRNKEIKKMLLLGTGALMSPLTVFQKESIAGICHLISLEGVDQNGIY